MYQPGQMRNLPYLTDEEKTMYGRGLLSLWNKMNGSPTNSIDQITARQRIVQFFELLTRKIQQKRNLAQERGQAQKQQQQSDGAQEQRTISSFISTKAFEELLKGLSALSNILNAKLYLFTNSEDKREP